MSCKRELKTDLHHTSAVWLPDVPRERNRDKRGFRGRGEGDRHTHRCIATVIITSYRNITTVNASRGFNNFVI